MGGECKSFRWEQHPERPDGQIQDPVEAVTSMTEQRLLGEYSDYLAIQQLPDLRSSEFEDKDSSPWKGLTWNRSRTPAREGRSRQGGTCHTVQAKKLSVLELALPITRAHRQCVLLPFLRADASQISFEIRGEYAKRSLPCKNEHNGLRLLIDEAQWESLARLLINDKKKLREIWKQQDLQGQRARMMECVEAVQNEWFEMCFREKGWLIRYILTEKGMERRMNV
ncbi:MAG: hypothetical protein Q9220_006997 [cf. Caloplaca sp. 1 TL-2023]